jgi:alpha-1,2-mannosyltransferase
VAPRARREGRVRERLRTGLTRPGVLAALVALDAVAAAVFYDHHGRGGLAPSHKQWLDLAVYRNAAGAFIHGGTLYGALHCEAPHVCLPFTYPPVAAALFSPLWAVSLGVAGIVMLATTLALVAATLSIVVHALGVGPWRLCWALALAAAPLTLFLQPVRSTLAFGQINVVMMALVVADCLLAAPRRPRGVLVGLAAAVKLTPMAFVLFFLVRGDRRAAGNAVTAFAGATLVGFVVAPAGSWRYWSADVLKLREGAPWFPTNQSILGVLSRLGWAERGHGGLVWLIVAAAVGALTVVAMRRSLTAGCVPWALTCNAIGALLVAPIAWTHHWVWMVPAIAILALRGWQARSALLLALAGAVCLAFVLPFPWWMPARRAWSSWQEVAGNTEVYCGLLLLAVTACVPAFRRALAAGPGGGCRTRSQSLGPAGP